MSRLLELAREQRTTCVIAVLDARNVKEGLVPARGINKYKRLIAHQVKRVQEFEQEMYNEINSRQYDIEEWIDLELMMVVSNLTNFRVNRLAYAGRVLP